MMVWETRGQHRRQSPRNQCGHFRHVTPRPGGVAAVEEGQWRAEDRVQGGRWDEQNTTPDQARNTFRGTSMERAIPRLCLAFLGRDGPRNGRIGGGRSSSLTVNLSRTGEHSPNQSTDLFRL